MFLSIQELKVHFPGSSGFLGKGSSEPVKAVDGVSLTLQKGTILGLVGESGCGKSTLSRAVMQLQAPTSGKIILEDRTLNLLPKAEIRKHRLDLSLIHI